MKTLQEVQEFNRRKIICAVNETEDYEEALKKELGVGCKVKIKNFITNNEFSEEIFVIDKYCNFFNETFFCKIGSYKHNEIIEIIGKPLTLDRVLLAIQRSSNWLAFWMNCHGDMIYEKLNKTNKRGKEIKIRWNLTEPTLEKQTKETQRAIYELLGGGNENK